MVSVIIPTYKHREYILRTLDSAFGQTFGDWEIVVVNDGSPDDTGEVLRPLVEAGRIRYIEQANAGQASARNRGIAEARGEFIALLDDDDLWPADSLARRVAALRQNPDVPLAYGGVTLIDADDKEMDAAERRHRGIDVPTGGPSGDVHADFAKRNYILSPGQTLLRRSLLPEPVFDTNIWGCDDYDLYLRLAERGEFVFVDGPPALRYRFHASNASRDFARMHRSELDVYAAHLRRLTDDPKHQAAIRAGMRLRRNTLAKYWLRRCLREWRDGDAASARSSWGTLWSICRSR